MQVKTVTSSSGWYGDLSVNSKPKSTAAGEGARATQNPIVPNENFVHLIRMSFQANREAQAVRGPA